MNKKSLAMEWFILVTMTLSLMPMQAMIAHGDTDNIFEIMSNGIILYTKRFGSTDQVLAEVNAFQPGDVILFYNSVSFVRHEGMGLTLNLTWHIVVLNPFNFTVYDADTHALYNNSKSTECSYEYHFDWNVTSASVDGNYVAVLRIGDSISNQSTIERAFFSVYGGLSRTVRYRLNHTIMLENMVPSTNMIRRLYIVKIPDIEGFQRVSEGPTYSRVPSGQLMDQFGNRYAVFNSFTLSPDETLNVTVSYVVEVNVSYVGQLDSPISEVNRTEFSIYLSSQQNIESNSSEIVSFANALAGNESNVYDIGKAIFDYTSTNITYSMELGEGQEGALWTLLNKRGVCRHFSALYTALARSSGIPSVVVMGSGFMDVEVGKSGTSSGTAHAWVLINVPECGWMPVEPQDGWWWGWEYGSSLPSHIIFVKGEYSKYNTEEGEAWVSSYTYWSDQSVHSEDILNYVVESSASRRQSVTMTVNTTDNIYEGSTLQIGCHLDTPINGSAMMSLYSPAGRIYQKYAEFSNGEAFFDWTVPARLENVGRWNVSIAFSGDELYEWCLKEDAFNVLYVSSPKAQEDTLTMINGLIITTLITATPILLALYIIKRQRRRSSQKKLNDGGPAGI